MIKNYYADYLVDYYSTLGATYGDHDETKLRELHLQTTSKNARRNNDTGRRDGTTTGPRKLLHQPTIRAETSSGGYRWVSVSRISHEPLRGAAILCVKLTVLKRVR